MCQGGSIKKEKSGKKKSKPWLHWCSMINKSFESLIVAPHNSTISLVKHAVDRRSLSIPRSTVLPSRPFVHRSNRCNVICSENIIPRYVCNVEIVNSASFIAADACASLPVIYVSNLNVMNIIAYVFCYYWKYFLKIFLPIYVVVVVVVVREYRLFILNCNLYWNTGTSLSF